MPIVTTVPPVVRRALDWRTSKGRPLASPSMSDSLDLPAFTERFRERAKAVRNRPMPPVEGPERQRFKDRMQVDFQDFAMIGDAAVELVDGILTLTVDLRP